MDDSPPACIAAGPATQHAGGRRLDGVPSDNSAADPHGGRPGSVSGQLAPAAPSQVTFSVPWSADAAAPHSDLSTMEVGDQHLMPANVVSGMAVSSRGACSGAPGARTSSGLDGSLSTDKWAAQAGGSGRQPVPGAAIGSVAAAAADDGPGNAAACNLVSGAVNGHRYHGAVEREDDGSLAPPAGDWVSDIRLSSGAGESKACSPTAATSVADWMSGVRPTSCGSTWVAGPGSGRGGMGSTAGPGAGLSSLLSPRLHGVTSAAGGGGLPPGLLHSPTRASQAGLPLAASSPGFVHGIPRLNGSVAAGTASQSPAVTFSAAGLAAAASFAAGSDGFDADSSALRSASTPPQRRVAAGAAIPRAGTAQNGLPGQAEQAAVAGQTPSAARVSGDAATGSPSSTGGPRADGHAAVAEGSRGAALHDERIGGGRANGTLASAPGGASFAGGTPLYGSELVGAGAQPCARVAVMSGPLLTERESPLDAEGAPLDGLPARLHQQVRFTAKCSFSTRLPAHRDIILQVCTASHAVGPRSAPWDSHWLPTRLSVAHDHVNRLDTC